MNIAGWNLADLVGVLLGLSITLSIFSYILGDNALFRLAIHIFIGVASGYVAVVAWYNILWPQLLLPLIAGGTAERLFVLIPFALSGLLLTKVSTRLAPWGNPVMAYLVGIGVATAIGGAVIGTIFPQVIATTGLFDLQELQPEAGLAVFQLGNAGLILLATVSTLAYFHFGVRVRPDQPQHRGALVEGIAWVGNIFIAITFGVLFAGVYISALTALVERLHFLVEFLVPWLAP